MNQKNIHIGTAGWNIPLELRNAFPDAGTVLQKYSQGLNAVEINSSFYKDHKDITYQKWARSTPEDFQFSVKLSKDLTHEKELSVSKEQIQEKILPIQGLGKKLGCLLVQLPPSLNFQIPPAFQFLQNLRAVCPGDIVFEPRHPSWELADTMFRDFAISQVISDPKPYVSQEVFESPNLIYYRLHGSPRVYKSNYPSAALEEYAKQIRSGASQGKKVWCLFDNSTYGFSINNALEIQEMLGMTKIHNTRLPWQDLDFSV